MEVFNNVTSIRFEIAFEGSGIINGEAVEEKYALRNNDLWENGYDITNKNYSFAKRHYDIINPEDNVEEQRIGYRIIVSPQCIHHNTFKIAYSQRGYKKIPQLLYPVITQPEFILKGYMSTEKDTRGIKRKGVVSLAPAETVRLFKNKPSFHIRTSTQEFVGDSRSMSFYENIGTEKYVAHGNIDLTELQFLSDDLRYDRAAVGVFKESDEMKQMYLDYLKDNFGVDYKFGYYCIINDLYQDIRGEFGILFTRENVDMLVKYYLKHLMNCFISKREGYFHRIGELKITMRFDDGTESSDVFIKNPNDLDEYVFNYSQKYKECPNEIKELIDIAYQKEVERREKEDAEEKENSDMSNSKSRGKKK